MTTSESLKALALSCASRAMDHIDQSEQDAAHGVTEKAVYHLGLATSLANIGQIYAQLLAVTPGTSPAVDAALDRATGRNPGEEDDERAWSR